MEQCIGTLGPWLALYRHLKTFLKHRKKNLHLFFCVGGLGNKKLVTKYPVYRFINDLVHCEML